MHSYKVTFYKNEKHWDKTVLKARNITELKEKIEEYTQTNISLFSHQSITWDADVLVARGRILPKRKVKEDFMDIPHNELPNKVHCKNCPTEEQDVYYIATYANGDFYGCNTCGNTFIV